MGKRIIVVFIQLLMTELAYSASSCVFPELTGVTWNENSAGIQNRPGDGVFFQVGGKLTPGVKLVFGTTTIYADPKGNFSLVLPLADRSDHLDWLLTRADGSAESVRVRYDWKKHYPGFDRFFSEPDSRTVGEWLIFSCENSTGENQKDFAREAKRLSPYIFSLSGLLVLSEIARYSLSPQIEWTPHFQFNDSWAVSLSVAGSVIRYDAQTTFVALEADILGKYRLLKRLIVAAGAGVHLWLAIDRLAPHFAASIAVPFEIGDGFSLKEIFTSFGHYFSSTSSWEVFKLGARIEF